MKKLLLVLSSAVVVACGPLAQSSPSLTKSVPAFSADEMAALKQGKISISRYGQKSENLKRAFPIVDAEGFAWDSDYDVAVEFKAFIPVPAGSDMEAMETRLVQLTRDARTWRNVLRHGDGEPLYSGVWAIDADGRPATGVLPTGKVSGTEHYYVKTETPLHVAMIDTSLSMSVHVVLGRNAEGDVESTMVNVEPMMAKILGPIAVPLVSRGDFRNYQILRATEGGFLYYAIGRIRGSHDFARSNLGPDSLEPGIMGSFIYARNAVAR